MLSSEFVAGELSDHGDARKCSIDHLYQLNKPVNISIHTPLQQTIRKKNPQRCFMYAVYDSFKRVSKNACKNKDVRFKNTKSHPSLSLPQYVFDVTKPIFFVFLSFKDPS